MTMGVMAGLVPAIHLSNYLVKDVDARDRRGHDIVGNGLKTCLLE
jgi:hypothetical protein